MDDVQHCFILFRRTRWNSGQTEQQVLASCSAARIERDGQHLLVFFGRSHGKSDSVVRQHDAHVLGVSNEQALFSAGFDERMDVKPEAGGR